MVYVEQKGHVHSVNTVFVFVLPGEGGDHHDAERGNIRGNSSNMERNRVQSHSDGSGLQRPRDSAVCYRGTNTHTHTCSPSFILSLLISPFYLLTQSSSPPSLPRLVSPGVWSRFQCRRARPRNDRRQRRLQHVCNHRDMCVDHSQRREPQDQTPPGVLHHRLLEHLCLHLALPHPVCHDSGSCGCKAEWGGNTMLIESDFC